MTQGIPLLVGLIEDAPNTLAATGLAGVWRLLDSRGMIPLNHLCRLLAAAGLAHRLVATLMPLAAAAARGAPGLHVSLLVLSHVRSASTCYCCDHTDVCIYLWQPVLET